MSREQMRELQGKRLQKLVTYVYHNVPFYRSRMQEMDLSPDDIRTIDDIVKLPFTTKQDLRDNYPYGLQAAPPSEIVRVHASSGTTGNPTIVGYTRRDLSIWSEVMSRCLSAYGVTRDDTFSVSYGYGLFTGGLGAHYGVENLGATVIYGKYGKACAPDSRSPYYGNCLYTFVCPLSGRGRGKDGNKERRTRSAYRSFRS